MTDASVDAVIDRLSGDLRPVRRLNPPWLRSAVWLGAVGAAALALAGLSDLGGTVGRLRAAPDMWLAVLGSTATAVLAAAATFQLSLPDRSARWGLLPVPGLVLWVAATGAGCLRGWVVPDAHAASMEEARVCFAFIVGLSVPLSALTLAMVRRAYSLRPNLTASTGGLAVAAAAATLLNFFHPYDAGATDIAVHVLAIGLVIAANRAVGGRLLRRPGP